MSVLNKQELLAGGFSDAFNQILNESGLPSRLNSLIASVGVTAGSQDMGTGWEGIISNNLTALQIMKLLEQEFLSVEGRILLPAFEALNNKDFVSIFEDSGVTKVRKAVASDPTKVAMGFVKADYAIGDTVAVIRIGLNPVTVSTFSQDTYLSPSTAGLYVTTKPTTSGQIVQNLGPAIPGQGIHFTPQNVSLIS